MRIAAVALLLAPLTASAAPDPLVDALARLADLRCPTIKRLEPLLGPQSYTAGDHLSAPIATTSLAKLGVTKASAELVFDIYHQDPRKVTDPVIGSLALDIADTLVEPALAAVPGFVHRGEVMQVRQLFHRHGSNSVVIVCGDQPAWARVAWTPAAEKQAVINTVALFDDKDPGFVETPDGKQVLDDERVTLTREATSLSAKFKTPIPAAALLTALGLTKVTYKSDDVHMSHWTLHTADGKRPSYKRYRLDITLDGEEHVFGKPRLLDISKIRIDSIYANPR